MKKPTIEQVAWVIKHIARNIRFGGTFRHLIYDRMEFDGDSYLPLYEAGGMYINNLVETNELKTMDYEVNWITDEE